MRAKLFISYAWTSDAHRKWVRLLATQLRLLGYAVQIDSDLPYGSSLSGFMREVTEADRVLMIVDENYVERADHLPDSGVAIENQWIRSVFEEKNDSWLSVLFVDNPKFDLPKWIKGRGPKGFNFNSMPDKNNFPGVEQLDDLWRWIEGLSVDKAHALPAAILFERMARIERIDAMRDPANYASPALKDRITFRHKDHPYYKLGHGEYEFKVKFGDHSSNGVYVLTDGGLKSVGLITASEYDSREVGTFLKAGRYAEPVVGQSVVMMNLVGALCVIKIEGVQREVNGSVHIPSEVTFSYQILIGQ